LSEENYTTSVRYDVSFQDNIRNNASYSVKLRANYSTQVGYKVKLGGGIVFDEEYFENTQGLTRGYSDYQDYPHFATRAQWLADYMTTEGYTHVTVLGAAYGYLIKYLVETHSFTTSTVTGIENSDYAITQANALGYGVTQGYMIKADIEIYVYPATDLIISWGVLDSLPSLTAVTNAIIQANDSGADQIHVVCTDDDPNNTSYSNDGYSIPNINSLRNDVQIPPNMTQWFVRFHDGFTAYGVKQGNSNKWTVGSLLIPLIQGRVGD